MKLSTLSDKQISKRLNLWFYEATQAEINEGLTWYESAQTLADRLSKKFCISKFCAATVISSLSPLNKWDRNKKDAWSVCKAWSENKGAESVKVCTFTSNKIKAFRALDGARIAESAPKTNAFAENVGNLSRNHVTIDRWIIRAMLVNPSQGKGKTPESITLKQYKRCEVIISSLASDLGLTGYQLQAIVWVTIKRIWSK